jgi:hypothetical protein
MGNAIFTPLSLQNLLNLIQEEIQNVVKQFHLSNNLR